MLSRPVPGAITSGFGYRVHPIFQVQKLHTGVDFQAAQGDPIKAAAAGEVVFSRMAGRLWQVHHHRPRRRSRDPLCAPIVDLWCR